MRVSKLYVRYTGEAYVYIVWQEFCQEFGIFNFERRLFSIFHLPEPRASLLCCSTACFRLSKFSCPLVHTKMASREEGAEQQLPAISNNWEQRLGYLIERTGNNLSKLQASYSSTTSSSSLRRHGNSSSATFKTSTTTATTTSSTDVVRMLNTPRRGRDGRRQKADASDKKDNNHNEYIVGGPLPAPPTETRINRFLPPDTWAGGAAYAMSTRTRVITKEIEDSMVRSIEQSLRTHLDRILEDRISTKLAELENAARNDEMALLREQIQTMSNNIKWVNTELQIFKQQLGRQEQTMNEVQKNSQPLMQTLPHQVKTLTEERKKQINRQQNITTTVLPTIQSHIKSLEETCISHQSQLTALYTRYDETEIGLNSAYVAATSAVTSILTPYHAKLQHEVRTMKNYVIENSEKNIISQNDAESVVELITSKATTKMQEVLAAEAQKLIALHLQNDQKKNLSLLHSMFENLDGNLRNTMDNQLFAFSEHVSSLLEELCSTVIPSKVYHVFESNYLSKIQEEVRSIAHGAKERIKESLQNLTANYSQDVTKEDCVRILLHNPTEDLIRTADEWMEAMAKYTIESALSDALASTKQIEEDHVRKLTEQAFDHVLKVGVQNEIERSLNGHVFAYLVKVMVIDGQNELERKLMAQMSSPQIFPLVVQPPARVDQLFHSSDAQNSVGSGACTSRTFLAEQIPTQIE